MKIYTRIVLDWDGNTIEEDSYEYDGPVAQAGGAKSPPTTTTVQQADPWSGVQPYLTGAYGEAERLFQQGGPQYYPGQTYAPRDPLEEIGQTMALQTALGPLSQQAGTLSQAQRAALMAPDVARNPYVGGMADVIQSRMGRQFTEQINPALRSGAVAAGQLGGSRQALSQAMAARASQEATGDALANLYGDAYGRGLEAQGRALVTAPQTMQASMMPSQQVGQVGAYRRGEQELALQDAINRWNYEQQLPYQNLQNYMGILQGAPWGSTSTGTMPAQRSSPVTGALGGGMLGASLAPMLGFAGPLGFGAGALLGGLFG